MVFQKRILPIALAGIISVSMFGCGRQRDTSAISSNESTSTHQVETQQGNPLSNAFNRVFGEDDSQEAAEDGSYSANTHLQVEENVAANEVWEKPGADQFANNQIVSCADGLGGTISIGVASGAVSGDIGLEHGLILNVTDTKATSGEVLLGVRFQPEYGTINAIGGNGLPYDLSIGSAYEQTTDELSPVMAIGRTFDERLSAAYESETAPGPVWTYAPEDFAFPDSLVISMELYNLLDNSFVGYFNIRIARGADESYELASIEPYQETRLTPAEVQAVKEGVVLKMQRNDLFTTTQVFTEDDVILKSVYGARWSEMCDSDGNSLLSANVSKTNNMVAATVNTRDGRIGPVTLYYQLIRSAEGEEQSEGKVNEKTTAIFYGYDLLGQTSWEALVDLNALSDVYGQIGSSTFQTYRPIR